MAMGWDEDAPDAGGVEELRRQVEALWLENAVMGETIRVVLLQFFLSNFCTIFPQYGLPVSSRNCTI